MNVWEICIRRPIFTLMLVCAPVVLGLAAYPQLGVDLFPNVDLPVVVYQGFDSSGTPLADVPVAPASAGIADLRLVGKLRSTDPVFTISDSTISFGTVNGGTQSYTYFVAGRYAYENGPLGQVLLDR